LLAAAFLTVLRARALARRLDDSRGPATRSPLEDLRRVLPVAVPALSPAELLALTMALAAAAAFVRDRAEHASPTGALVTAGIEALAVVACFATLGRPLGLHR
jgi:hypothetical protein